MRSKILSTGTIGSCMTWLCLLLLISGAARAQTMTTAEVTGTVLTEKGEMLRGVTVLAKNMAAGSADTSMTTTDANGVFIFKQLLVGGRYDFSFSFVGFEHMQYKGFRVKQQSQSNTLLVRLRERNSTLDEVVVTALNIKRESRALSYSIQGADVNSMNEAKSPNILNSLSGKVAGLQIIPPDVNTGSARVVLRGNKSLTGNNQPLFVVDGMPIDNAPGDGNIDYGNNAADINAEDIESIQVLKGPNAAALYGSRAGNGVILINTKKGTNKFKITLNSSTYFQKLTEFPEYQNAYGVGTSFYIDNTHRIPEANVNYRSWGAPMLGQPYVGIDGEVKPYLPHPDNVKDFYQTAMLMTNSMAIEGGNASNTYRIAYTNYKGQSVVKGFNEIMKHNLEFRMQNRFTSWFNVDTKIGFVRETVDNRQYSNSNGRNPTNLYTHMARSTDLAELTPYKDSLTGLETGTHRNFSNPYWVVNENPNQDVKDRVIAVVSPEIQITPWAKFTGRAGTDSYWWDGYEFNNIGSIIASNPDGFLRTFNTKQQTFNVEGIFSVNRKFKDFSFLANFGASMYTSNNERRETRVNSLLQPGFINLANAKEFPVVSQAIRPRRIYSVFGSVSLGYRNYAFVDLTARNDKSSTLPTANNSYFYPSIGTSLILTDMFSIKSKLLNFAKLRASIAWAGNDADPHQLEDTYTMNGFFSGAAMASLSTIKFNPDLKPERTQSFEYGFDVRMLNNRLNLSGTYYNTVTTNQIIRAQLPPSSGYLQRIFNAGKISNKGYELVANGTIINGKKFKWDASVNFSKNNSKVVELIDSVPRFQLNNNSSFIYVYAEVGKPYGYMRGLGVARDAEGHMLIEDGGSLLVKNNDMEFGTSTPDWLAGITNTFHYGNFDLSFLIDIRKGGVMYSGSYSRMLTNGVVAETLYGRDDYYKHTVIYGESNSELSGGAMWDAYFADGTKNTKYVTPQNYEYARPNYAEFVMFKASFVKLRELAFGYTFGGNQLKKTPFKSARVSLSGRNLWIIHRETPLGIDPEATSTSGNGQGIENGSLPPNAIYGFNVRLTF